MLVIAYYFDVRNILLAQRTTDGDDRIFGFDSNDVIVGGAGDDFLSGDDGSDLYLYARGDGADIIDDNGDRDTDRLEITGYSTDELELAREGNALVIKFAGEGDVVAIINYFLTSSSGYGDNIEQIAFEDGTVWTQSSVIDLIAAQTASDGGDNVLLGGDGADSFIFARGDGSVIIRDGRHFGDLDVLNIEGYELEDISFTRSVYNGNDLLIRAY